MADVPQLTVLNAVSDWTILLALLMAGPLWMNQSLAWRYPGWLSVPCLNCQFERLLKAPD
jgi:hypothetical protein